MQLTLLLLTDGWQSTHPAPPATLSIHIACLGGYILGLYGAYLRVFAFVSASLWLCLLPGAFPDHPDLYACLLWMLVAMFVHLSGVAGEGNHRPVGIMMTCAINYSTPRTSTSLPLTPPRLPLGCPWEAPSGSSAV